MGRGVQTHPFTFWTPIFVERNLLDLVSHPKSVLEGVLINVGDLPTGTQWLAIIGYNRWAFEVSASRGVGRGGEGGEGVLLPVLILAHHSYIPPYLLSPSPSFPPSS